jgi:hypothetical protein
VIFFVDEDATACAAWHAELRMRGLKVGILPDATTAFATLWDIAPTEVQLVLIDVMLAVGDAVETSPYWSELPTAGLRLLADLVQQNPEVFPAKALLFTNAVGEVLDEAIACAERFGVPLWDKRSITSPMLLADLVAGQLELRQ